MSTPISITRIISGIADYDKESVLPDSVSFARRVDFRTNPRRWTLLPRPTKESGTQITDLPKWGERVSDDVYIYGDTGNIYIRDSNAAVTLERVVSDSHGNGLKYYGEDGYLYYTRDKVIGRYGRIGSSPSYTDDFLGAQGGIPLNTASLNLEASSSHYATAADSASLSITGDITLETYRKPESLPTAGSEMVLMSKWTENGNLRSYKWSIYAVSGYFGDASDGTLTVAANATDAPIDSACSGTSGTNSLTATNASFAADQIVFIHQTRGTGAGTWQRNSIASYTAGTITLNDNLNFSYSSTGSSKAQVLVLKEYDDVTINTGVTLTAKAWTGTVGGILAFIASGTITVTGTISANGKGFAGGSANVGQGSNTAIPGYQGEGTGGAGTTSTAANGNGGGGGGGGNPSSSGGGGGNGVAGTNGTGANYGTGGTTAGAADLTTIVFGGGGSGGGGYDNIVGGVGGAGGGIVFLTGATTTITGSITTNGSNGAAVGNTAGSGGSGGAGGSVLVKAQTATLGAALIVATAGSGGSAAVQQAGVAGGVGRIHLDYYTSYTGTTSPTLDVAQDSSLVTNTTYQSRLAISDDGTDFENYTKSLSTIAVDQWIHLGVKWDASESTATFWEGGVNIGTATGAMTEIDDNTSLFAIGASFDAAGDDQDHYDGKTDEDRVWNILRSDDEIAGNNERELGELAGLVAYYQHDSALTDSSAQANTLTHVNTPSYDISDVPFPAATTRLDIDQSSTGTGDTTATAVAISEGATARQSFVPAKDPQKSISIFIADTGDDPDWTVTVHDAQNRVIATKTIAYASVTTGENEFIFDTPWRPILGATYHFHVTTSTVTGDPDVVSSSNNDLETAQFYSYYQFLVTDTDYHPAEQIINLLAIGNERYLATWDATTYNPHRLTFPSGWRVRCFGLWREYLAIGCWRGSAIEDYDQGIIFFWDGISDTYNFYITVPEGGVNAMFGAQGTLYIVAGYEGNLLEYTGGDKAVKVKQLPQLATGEQIEVYPQAMNMWKTLLRIGAGVTDSSTFEQGVYTWGSLNRNYPESLSYDYTISTGNSTATNIKIGMLLPIDKKLLIGWKDNLSYGLDSINPAGNPYSTGSIEFLVRDENVLWKEKDVDLIRADFEELGASESIGLQYKLDRNDIWSTEELEDTDDATYLRTQVSNGRHREYQVRVNLKTDTTTSPAVLGVTIVENALEDEEFI